MKRGFCRFSALFVILTVLTGFMGGVRGAEAATYVDTSEYTDLAKLYSPYFIVGSACEAISHWHDSSKEIGNPSKEAVLANLFNSITCGNEMKPAYNFSAYSEGLFRIDSSATEMMRWAKEHNILMRGHTLVWHSQVDPSIFAKDFIATVKGIKTSDCNSTLDPDCLVDRDTLVERLRTYIYSMMEYVYSNGFGDVIYAWDVVNEASDESQADGMRRSYWYKIIGPEYLYYAFLFAREASVKYAKQYASLYELDPEGDLSSILPKLFYNDYNEWFTTRCDKIITFLTKTPFNADRSLASGGVIRADGDGTIYGDGLIDGIGMQGHLTDTQNIDTYIRALMKYSEAVDEVHITELDVGTDRSGENKWFFQAQFYYNFFSALIDAVNNGAKLTSVTFWGLTDSSSWRSDVSPLLFRSDLSKKPAFDAVVMAGRGEEFSMTLADTVEKVGAVHYDFENKTVDGKTVMTDPAELGFTSRGSGHQSDVNLQFNVNHTPDMKVGFSLHCSRKESDATLRLDLSRFTGCKVLVSAYVRSDDPHIYMGVDRGEPELLDSAGPDSTFDPDGWAHLMAIVDITKSSGITGLYFETDGRSDIFVDDVDIEVTTMTEDELALMRNRESSTYIKETVSENGDNFVTDASASTLETAQNQEVVQHAQMSENDLLGNLPNAFWVISAIAVVAIVALIILAKKTNIFSKK